MSAKKILSTSDYRLFTKGDNNRPENPNRHKALLSSMQEYGFIDDFPIVVAKSADLAAGKFEVKDGQHRLMFAEMLGLPVHYVVSDMDWDVAKVNSAAKPWTLQDYAQKWADAGLLPYTEVLDFAITNHLALGTAAALLGGVTVFSSVEEAFKSGKFEVKDRVWADAVVSLYCAMVELSPEIGHNRFMMACMAVCRVPEFDSSRLIAGAKLCRDAVVNYPTRDAFLTMMELVYNYKRFAKSLFALKMAAITVMRERERKKPQNGQVPRPQVSAPRKPSDDSDG